MYAIAQRFIDEQHGDVDEAAIRFARALMRDDPATCKVGYTPDNAALATAEAMDLDVGQFRKLCDEIDCDHEAIEHILMRDREDS